MCNSIASIAQSQRTNADRSFGSPKGFVGVASSERVPKPSSFCGRLGFLAVVGWPHEERFRDLLKLSK